MNNNYFYTNNRQNFIGFKEILYILPIVILFFSQVEIAWNQEEIISKNNIDYESKLIDNIIQFIS